MNIGQLKRILETDKMPGTTFSGFETAAGLHLGMGATAGNGIEGWAPGALFIDNDSASIVYNSGNAATAVWTAIVLAGQTLDAAFDGGAEIDGAVSSATAVQIGNGTDNITLYYEGADDVRISTLSNASLTIMTHGTGDLTLAPAGGNITLTGAVAVTGDVAITGALSVSTTLTVTGTIYLSGIAPSVSNGNLSLDGNGSGQVRLGETSTGNVALYRNTTLAASKTLTLAGVAGSSIFTITAGDAVVSDGSLTIADNDNAAILSLTNDTITTASLVTIASSSLTTGKALSVIADAVTSGALVYLETSAATFTGKYIECFDGAADDFSVGLYGATIIAGNAAGTDALTITAGDIGITAGYIDLDNGKIEVDTTGDLTNYFKRNRTGANTAAVVLIEATHIGEQKPALTVDGKMTGAYDAMTVTYAGTSNAVTITPSAATGTALGLASAASATDSILKIAPGGTGATGFLGAANVGAASIISDGNLAHANASLLYIAYSGTGAATGLGTSLRIVDTGATSTSWAVYISAATGEALYVAVGKAKFAESVTIDTGFDFTTSGAALTENATNTFFDAGAANETFNFGNTTATDVLMHGADATKDLLWDASLDSLSIGVAAAVARSVTDAKCGINIFDGTAPVGTLANGTTLYAVAGELKVMDATGNDTTLSPHDDDNRWVFDSKNAVTGQSFRADMQKILVKLAEKFPAEFAELVQQSGY